MDGGPEQFVPGGQLHSVITLGSVIREVARSQGIFLASGVLDADAAWRGGRKGFSVVDCIRKPAERVRK